MGACLLGKGLNCSPVLFQVWVVTEGELKARRGPAWEEGRVERVWAASRRTSMHSIDRLLGMGEEECRLSALDSSVLKAS